MAARLSTLSDLLGPARALASRSHAVALLDSPPDDPAARQSHLVLLDEPLVDRTPPPETEHLCLATYDHGLALQGLASRHAPVHDFALLAYPVRARWTLDRMTGALERHGEAGPLPRAETTGTFATGPQRASHDAASFAAMVRQAQAAIAEGHSYQVNLSLRLSAPFEGDAFALFDRLRRLNPSPYQALLVAPEVSLVSASPELLVRTQGQHLVTRPIAGTRPRGASPQEDAALEAELVRDVKERAEHAMLVDLARNDLGRVAAYGTVAVADLAVVERYSHVMHLVSEVVGELAPDHTAWDAFEAVFPCGTITGAPKRRSMELIDALEPTSRGCYTGSLGLVGPDASVWNILIRTAVLTDGAVHVQAGAGIVADSVPEREYHESLQKARALLEVLAGGSP